LHEQQTSLESICWTLDNLFNHWREIAKNDNSSGAASKVSAVEDLSSLRDEFKSQLKRREELEKRLNNV
jgi:flagellar hook-associated protein FlgK